MSQAERADPPDKNTRERILAVAMHEFSEHGSSGARVDRIAKAAGVNIRMIYYFFGSKKALLDEVLSQIFRERKAQTPDRYEGLEALLTSYFDGYAADPNRVRLLQWEALEATLPKEAKQLTNLVERRAVIAQRIGLIADLQARGKIPAHLDPQMLYLLFVALSIYPMSFPQSVYVATGEHASSKAFLKRYRAFLSQVATSWRG